MMIFNSILKLRQHLEDKRKEGFTVGFVPTMGYLHQGHLSLIKTSVEENDLTVLSIYVNPTQFAPNEDLDKYPRDIEKDKELAQEVGADIIFIPTDEIMYKKGHRTYVNVEGLTEHLCGRSRPTHFQGVTTIVAKLLNIVSPHRAYFGQKDAQQAIVIKRMVEDLNMHVKVVVCPIVREEDGLAMSSRNTYLGESERHQAVVLYKALQEAKTAIGQGLNEASKVRELMHQRVLTQSAARIDYVSIVNEDTLEEVTKIKGKILIAIAVKFGSIRLIDNIRMEVL